MEAAIDRIMQTYGTAGEPDCRLPAKRRAPR